jgi:hypothetical protein
MIYGDIKSSPWNSIDTVAEMWNNRYFLMEITDHYSHIIEMFDDKSYNKVLLSAKEGRFLIEKLKLLKVVEDYNYIWITAKQIIGRIEQKQEIIKQKSVEINECHKDIQMYNSILLNREQKQNETNIQQ